MFKRFLLPLLAFSLLLAACGPAPDPAAAIATDVAATLQAGAPAIDPVATADAATLQAGAPPAPATSAPTTGLVQGKVCYPSSGIPPMTVYLYDSAQATLITVPIAQNQSEWQTDLPAGNYIATAWLPDFSYGGSYSPAVPCGLSVDCNDHAPLQFSVVAGATLTGIDVCDWYGDPGAVPLPPGVQPPTGAISGDLSYPSSFIPPLVIIATNTNSGDYFYIQTTQNTTSYTLENLPAGQYTVIAYIADDNTDYAGGYTAAVPCGLSVDCGDHSLLVVTVTPGQTTGGVNPQDWYAPPGTYPPNPLP